MHVVISRDEIMNTGSLFVFNVLLHVKILYGGNLVKSIDEKCTQKQCAQAEKRDGKIAS